MSNLEGRGRPDGFEIFYPWADELDLSDSAFRLWYKLRVIYKGGMRGWQANPDEPRMVKMPTYGELAELMGCTDRSISRYLDELQAKGLAGRVQSRRSSGNFGQCAFWVWIGSDAPVPPDEIESMELQDDLPGLDAEEGGEPGDHRLTPVSDGGVTSMSGGGTTPVSDGRMTPVSDAIGTVQSSSGEEDIGKTVHPSKSPPSGVSPEPESQPNRDGPAWAQMSDADRDAQALEDFKRLCGIYPLRAEEQGYPEAQIEFERCIRGGVGVTVILEGAQLYRDAKEASGDVGTKMVIKLAKWLKNRGWLDVIVPPSAEIVRADKKHGKAPAETAAQMKARLKEGFRKHG